MPCGGIYPSVNDAGHKCFQCHEEGADHFCEEWDCFLHGKCVPAFLMTEEGKIVLAHGHEVFISPDWAKREATMPPRAVVIKPHPIHPRKRAAIEAFVANAKGKRG